jgi:hypothetical protein
MQIADYPVKAYRPPPHYGPFSYRGAPYAPRPSFASCARALAPKTLATLNGGFEQPEDKFSNWVVGWSPRDFRSDDVVYGEWKEAHFLHDGDRADVRRPGAAGTGYLRLDAGLPKWVRRVVEGLESGREYRASVWVKQAGTGTATFAVHGFDQERAGHSSVATTATVGDWVNLSVSFVPRRSVVGVDCWGVISLESSGRSAAWWDDVTLTPAR